MAVLNKYRDQIPSDAVYIGRGSKWGNPFKITGQQNREAVIAAHKDFLRHQVQIGQISLGELVELRGKDLVCFCAPLACHGDTLVEAAEWAYRLQEKNNEY